MSAVLRELRDPAGFGLALLTGVANLAIGVRPALAAAAVIAVLAVRVAAGLVWPGPTSSVKMPSADLPATATSIVTKRELEIAGLIADGLSNKEIAAKIFRSERTVDNHVQHLLNKLNFNSRAQIAAWIARQRVGEK